MKTLGIIGGLGPESTIEYYRFILDGYRARVTDGSAPHVIIDSLDVNHGIAMLDTNDLAGLADYISASVQRLAHAGAEAALMAANTPHIVFDKIEQRASIPMIALCRQRAIVRRRSVSNVSVYSAPGSRCARDSIRMCLDGLDSRY